MNISLTVRAGRVSPCFSGSDLWIIDSELGLDEARVIGTSDWCSITWRNELMRSDVSALLCSGIDNFMAGVLNGCGIDVVSNIIGSPEEVFRAWNEGALESEYLRQSRLGMKRRRHRKRNR